ncbi:hypothetical protein BKA93DRAFT_148250 [Sparassis latifolia]
MRDRVIVSEAHRYSSYARYLSSPGMRARDVVIGLHEKRSGTEVGAADNCLEWIHNATTGDFKSKVSGNGNRSFCPLFRLVSLKTDDRSLDLRGASDGGLSSRIGTNVMKVVSFCSEFSPGRLLQCIPCTI